MFNLGIFINLSTKIK